MLRLGLLLQMVGASMAAAVGHVCLLGESGYQVDGLMMWFGMLFLFTQTAHRWLCTPAHAQDSRRAVHVAPTHFPQSHCIVHLRVTGVRGQLIWLGDQPDSYREREMSAEWLSTLHF